MILSSGNLIAASLPASSDAGNLKGGFSLQRSPCYSFLMTGDHDEAALDRVEPWNAHDLSLADEQLAEVRRRRAENNPNRIPFGEVFGRFHARRAPGSRP
jgi:hypothetical protein